MKTVYRILLFILLALAALGIWSIVNKFSFQKTNRTEEAQVLLESVKKVAKLIAVEGYISEIYSYKDFHYYDFQPLRKQALVRVKAKVSVGYDFETITMEVNPDQRMLKLYNIPKPSILSIDHDLDYYDIQEGIFNSFSSQDMTELNKKAKEFIRSKALESELFASAEEQKKDILELISMMAKQSGWEVVIDEPVLKQ